MNEILDIYRAISFHHDEVISENGQIMLDFDSLTISKHFTMLAWLFNLVANKYTTSYQSYLDKCKELSIPHYIND